MRINRSAGARRLHVAGFAVLVALVLACCSGGSETAEPAKTDATARTATAPPAAAVADQAAQDPPPQAEPALTPTAPTAEDPQSNLPPATAIEPAVRLPENPGTLDETNWIARNFMDAESVDLAWSKVEGADVYRVYRLLTPDADYAAIQAGNLDGTTLVYEGPDLGYVDRSVEPDLFLTYVLVAQVGGDLTAPRWTEALTIEDTTPPSPITGLTARNTPEGVILEWQPATDAVEFASYSVSLLVDNQLRYLGGGADESQTSFLDTDMAAGARTYVVAAVDFHDNRGEPAQVEITR